LLIHDSHLKRTLEPVFEVSYAEIRVIIPDQLEAAKHEIMTASYDIKSQAPVSFDSPKLLNWKIPYRRQFNGRVHCGGVAADVPYRVISLALFDNSGITPPKKSEVQLALTGRKPLVVKTVEDYDRVMKLNFFKPLRIRGL